jgi:hypothetical protein
MAEWIGYWEIEAPVNPEEQDADMALLTQIKMPEEVTISRMTVWVHGREWNWTRVNVSAM